MNITPSAVVKMRELVTSAGIDAVGVRLSCRRGAYELQVVFPKQVCDHDRVFKFDGLNVYIDPKSYIYLSQCVLTYNDDLMNNGFKFVKGE